jgi:hypothetical protein
LFTRLRTRPMRRLKLGTAPDRGYKLQVIKAAPANRRTPKGKTRDAHEAAPANRRTPKGKHRDDVSTLESGGFCGLEWEFAREPPGSNVIVS